MNRTLILLALPLLAVSACGGPTHIRAGGERRRNYMPDEYAASPTAVSEGSLWLDSSRSIVGDFRAARVGDIVTIRIDESTDATAGADTGMNRQSEFSMGMGGGLGASMFGLLGALQALPQFATLNPEELLSLVSKTNFQGTGDTRRTTHAEASIAVRVKRELDNGDFFVEGTKIVMINDEENHVYISGVIRPADIEQDNSVQSALVADAQVEIIGRGALTENQEQGWLTGFLQSVNPF